MAKRFCDTEIWQKEWFQELSLKEKVLVKYIFENCDCAGVWEFNFRMASFVIGEKITQDDLKNINSRKELFIFFDENKLFVKKFIEFQYGVLSENCKPHKPIIEKLKKLNLFERVSKGYRKGIDTLEEKEKEKEQEKEKDNLSSFGSFLLSADSAEKEIEKAKDSLNMRGEYSNVYLTDKHYDALYAMVLDEKILQELINRLSEAIARPETKYKPYDERYKDAHYLYLKAFWRYRREHAEEFLPKTDADTGGREQDRKAVYEYIQRRKSEEMKRNEC